MSGEAINKTYKLTDAGPIPEDWESAQLVDVTKIVTCGVAATPTYVPESLGRPFLSAQNVRDGRVVFENYKSITPTWFERITKHNKPRKGDLLYTRVGAGIGQAAIVDFKDEFAIYVSLTLIRVDDKILNNLFAAYLLNSQKYQTLAKEGQYAGGGVQNLNVEIVRKFPIPIPALREQISISTALADADALLTKLDQLIAKKNDLKQAAMQQLLTGKTRLPGFSGEWEETTFNQVVRHHSGNSSIIKGKLSDTQASDLFPAYSASGQDAWCAHHEHEGDAIVVSAVGSRCGKAFLASGKWTAIANTHIIWPRENKINRHFLSSFVNDEDFWLKSGSGQPFVLFRQTFGRNLKLPGLLEQEAIAVTISDLDAELATLEARRDKTRALKQGMMQELLTGRIRLI